MKQLTNSHRPAPRRQAVSLSAALALLAACNGGTTLSLQQQLQETGQSVANLLPDPSLLDSFDGMTGNAQISSIGGTSETATGMREMLARLNVPREIYRDVRAAMLADDTTISLAAITDTRLTQASYDTIRFERTIQTGDPEAPVAKRVRMDVAFWDALGLAIYPSAPRAHTRVRDVYVVVQIADEQDVFDNDAEVGPHVGIAFATGLPATISSDFPDAEFPDLPADGAGLGALTLFVDLAVIGETPSVDTPDAVMVAMSAGLGTRHILTAARFADPLSRDPRVCDIRIEVGVGVTLATLLQPELRAQTDAQIGETLAVGFMKLGGEEHGAGFAPNPYDLTQLLHAWDAQGQIVEQQTPYTPPAAFAGWPGASTTWTEPIGQGIATAFEAALATAPDVSTWYPTTVQ